MSRRIWRLPGAANTHAVFFQSQRNLRKVLNKIRQLTIESPAVMAKLAIDRASIVFGEKSGDFHSKSGDREIFIILSKIGRSPEKSGDLEALCIASIHSDVPQASCGSPHMPVSQLLSLLFHTFQF